MSEFTGSFRVSPGMLEHLLAYLVHNKTVLMIAARKIDLDEDLQFSPSRPASAILGTIIRYYNSNLKAPDENVLECDVVSIIENSSLYTRDDLTTALEIIQWIYSLDSAKYADNTNHGLGVLNVFLKDVSRRRLAQKISDNFAEEANQQLPQIISEIEQRLSDIDNLGQLPDGQITDDLWITAKREGFKTGLSFVDSCILTYPGDVNVILGPTGGGKTTLSLQLLTSSARHEYHNQKDNCGLYIYFGYEDDISEANRKIISYAAKIRRESLANISTLDQLSTSNRLLPYEEKFYLKNANVPRRGERERLESIRPFLTECIRTFNYSGSRDQNKQAFGHGGIPEIRDHLEHIHKQTGKPIRMVVIDWAGMVVRRHLQKLGRALDRNIVLELESFVDRVHCEIASPFNCIVFVVHQLRGCVSKQSPISHVSHADAAWCSNFAVNAWNVVCLGPKDTESGAFTLSWTKTRRSATPQHVICRMHENFWQLVQDDDYYVDTISKRIASKHSREEVGYGRPKRSVW